jgi:hypothetical protein
MTTFFLSILLIVTIILSVVWGIALGYWAVLGILHFFHPGRTQAKPEPRSAPTLAPTAAGD